MTEIPLNPENEFEDLADGKEGSREKPFTVDRHTDIMLTETVKLPMKTWLASVKEGAFCFFYYRDTLFRVKPDGDLNYGDEESYLKDPEKARLILMKDRFIASLVERLQSKETPSKE